MLKIGILIKFNQRALIETLFLFNIYIKLSKKVFN